MKRILGTVLAASMVLSLSIPALAAGGDQEIENATSGQTTVIATTKANDPQYTISIPLYADFNDTSAFGGGTLKQNESGSYPISFAITMSNAKYFNGKQLKITYSGQGENGELILKNEEGDVIPFYVQSSSTHPEWDADNTFSILEQNASSEGAGGWGYARNLRIDRADITASGDFSGIMYFTFTLIDPE